jgi:hypothetical protein
MSDLEIYLWTYIFGFGFLALVGFAAVVLTLFIGVSIWKVVIKPELRLRRLR